MKYFLILSLLLLGSSCMLEEPATYPVGAKLCRKDPDCFEGQWCGFTDGFTAAHCKGNAIRNQYNLN